MNDNVKENKMSKLHPSMQLILKSMGRTDVAEIMAIWNGVKAAGTSPAVEAIALQLWLELDQLDSALRRQTEGLRAVVTQVEREQYNDAKMRDVDPMWIMQSAQQLIELKAAVQRHAQTAQMLNAHLRLLEH